jgi:hypothetical protein
MAFEPFFTPESEITRKVMRRIGERRAATIREALVETPSEPSAELDDADELLSSILNAFETEPESNAAADWEDQRWLGEVLYHFMGLRAGRTRRGVETGELTRNDIVEGMRNGLGLFYEEDRSLLEELSDDFSSWLRERKNVYVAGWGTILQDQNYAGSYRLVPLTAHSGEVTHRVLEIRNERARAAQGSVTADLDLVER